MLKTIRALVAVFALLSGLAAAGEPAGFIPQAELDALNRAIERERGSGNLGSQTLGDLRRLHNRLVRMRYEGVAVGADRAESDRRTALQPLDADENQRRLLQRLTEEAETGGRPARRALALYYLFLDDPEKAMIQWRLMGKATDADLPYLLVSSYLELALGEYNAGRDSLETALRLLDTRATLEVSTPVFCHNIGGYRIYTPRGVTEFLPGEELLIYIEIDGADFYPGADGVRECSLMFGLTLKDDSQRTVWAEPKYGEYTPQFWGAVRDLHAAITWRIPNSLQPGRYHLHVEAIEQINKRRGESVVGFNVGRRETNPERRVTSEVNQAEVDRLINDSQKTFHGGFDTDRPAGRYDGDFMKQKRFEMQQQFERNQKVE